MRMKPDFGMPVEGSLQQAAFAQLPGWDADNHQQALVAFRRSAAVMQDQFNHRGGEPRFAGSWEHWQPACQESHAATGARNFFETHFTACRVVDQQRPQGLFTGYYEPAASGSLFRAEGFEVPIYGKPADLVSFDDETAVRYGRMVDGVPHAYITRREIEQGALAGRNLEIVWLNSWVDAFFIHVQGSGRIVLPDGQVIRLAYAAKSGRPYTGIGGVLVERGILRKEDMSMQSLRRWMAANPQGARELMWQNESFVFFRKVDVEDPSLGAPGAQKVNLTPLRSLAVDRSVWSFGTPVWLDLMAPSGEGASLQSFQRLMIAQDTGSAIKGMARGDVYWGWGEAAALTAGHMASPGNMYVLLPKQLVETLQVKP